MFETFHFLRPDWLWAIIPVSLLLFFSIKSIKHSSAWDEVCDAPLLQYQLSQQQHNSKKSTRLLRWLIPFSFLMLLFSFTLIALAGPSWEKKDQPVFQQEDALVIVLDLSLSMNAEDIKPSRLERAKLKLTDILKQKKEGQTALVAFAGDAHVVSPLTIDNKTIISLLPALDITIMPLSGSHINDALSSAAELLKNSGFMHGDILLMTDGIDEQHLKKVRKKINSLRNQGYNLSIIGIGSRAGSPIPMPGSGGFIKDSSGQVVLSKLNTAPLKELARLGGGSYHTLSLDDSDFESLLDKGFSNNKQLTEQDRQDNYQEKEHEQWVDAGAYITLLILPLALLVFRKGLLSISLLFLVTSSFFMEPAIAQAVSDTPDSDAALPEAALPEAAEPATAAFTQFTQNKSWKNLWSTADQQGQKAFNNKNYTTAAEQFNNSHWKAGSYYRAGKFEQAIEQYEQLDDADSLFNKGNSLAHLQQYEQAIQSYDDALEKDPDLSDAIKNRDAIKEFLEQQKQQSEQQKQQESDSSKDENKDKEQQQNKEQDAQQENSDQQENDQSKQQEQQNNSENNDSEQDSEQSPEQNSDQNSEQQDAQNNQSEQPDEAADEKQEQSQQQQAEDEAEEKDPHQAEQQQVEKSDAEAGENTADDVLSQLSQEQQQSLKQWLQRIPDNPGELLRIKFRNNSLNKQRQQNTPEQYEGNPW